MEITKLNPNQIITLNDYPAYSKETLIKYLKKCKLNKKLPLIPLIRKGIVRKYLNSKLLKKLEKFEKINHSAKYFMLDGTHRTTALTLTDKKIDAVILEKNNDVEKAKKLIKKGKILKNGIFNHTIKENCEILNIHFKKKPYFMTVEQKTKKMVKDKKLSHISKP